MDEIKEDYMSVLNKYEEVLSDDINRDEITLEVDIDKKQLFFKSSERILTRHFKDFSRLFSTYEISSENKVIDYYLVGGNILSNKEVFYESGIDHLNFDTFLAESIAFRFCQSIMNIFFTNTPIHYVFSQEKVFPAIKELNLNKDYKIITFGLSLDYYISHLNVPKLSSEYYNNDVQIIPFNMTPRNLGAVIFIIKESDFPRIKYLDIDQKIVQMNEFELINEDYFLYGSVSDLNRNEELRNELIKSEKDDDDELRKKVFQSIAFRGNIRWLEGIEAVSIQIKNNWDNQRKENSLEDVLPLP